MEHKASTIQVHCAVWDCSFGSRRLVMVSILVDGNNNKINTYEEIHVYCANPQPVLWERYGRKIHPHISGNLKKQNRGTDNYALQNGIDVASFMKGQQKSQRRPNIPPSSIACLSFPLSIILLKITSSLGYFG